MRRHCGGRKSHGQHTSINRIIKQHKNLTYFPLSHFGCASISSTYPSQSVRPSYVTHSDFNRTMRVTVVTVSLIQEVAKNAPSDQLVPVGGILLILEDVQGAAEQCPDFSRTSLEHRIGSRWPSCRTGFLTKSSLARVFCVCLRPILAHPTFAKYLRLAAS